MLIVFAEQARVDAKLVVGVAALPGLLRVARPWGEHASCVLVAVLVVVWADVGEVGSAAQFRALGALRLQRGVRGTRRRGWRRAGTGASRSRASSI